jgi:iron(II)-dependent oxidoreductase
LPERGLRAGLLEARERTLMLVDSVREEDLDRVHDALMSPLAWDLGHIAAFEDLWVSRATDRPALRPELFEVYDAEETPRAERGELAYLRHTEAREYLAEVGDRALDALSEADLEDSADPLNHGGLVWELVLRHEHQHNETMLQTLQIAAPGVFRPERSALDGAGAEREYAQGPDMIRVEGGAFPMGAGSEGFAYDNERPRHEVELRPFEIDRTLVTNAAFLAWVRDGGYERREWWTEAGWAWRCSESVQRPRYWNPRGLVRAFDREEEPLRPELPVMHLSWYEADAYARAHAKRLLTEAEWEMAASWDPRTGEKRRYPWGHDEPTPERTILDQLPLGPASVDAHPGGASPLGVLGLIGNAWEWTASMFEPYPAFRAHPYPEYSQAHFGQGYRVIRGGSWATRARTIDAMFRSWDLPERRQIFVGFRCAADG